MRGLPSPWPHFRPAPRALVILLTLPMVAWAVVAQSTAVARLQARRLPLLPAPRLPSRRRQRHRPGSTNPSTRRAGRQEWRILRGLRGLLSPPPSCGPWPSNWPRCARLKLMREWPPMRAATPAMPPPRLTLRWATRTCWTNATPMRKRRWLWPGARTVSWPTTRIFLTLRQATTPATIPPPRPSCTALPTAIPRAFSMPKRPSWRPTVLLAMGNLTAGAAGAGAGPEH